MERTCDIHASRRDSLAPVTDGSGTVSDAGDPATSGPGLGGKVLDTRLPAAPGSGGGEDPVLGGLKAVADVALVVLTAGVGCVTNGLALAPAASVARTYLGSVAPGFGNVAGGSSGAVLGFGVGCVYGAGSPDPVTGLGVR